jgi:hypothetical protein
MTPYRTARSSSARSESEQAVPDSAAVRGFGASQGSCDPVKVTRPELRIESGILPTCRRSSSSELSFGDGMPHLSGGRGHSHVAYDTAIMGQSLQ